MQPSQSTFLFRPMLAAVIAALLIAAVPIPATKAERNVNDVQAKQKDEPLEVFRKEIYAALTKVEPNPKNKMAVDPALRREFARIIDKHAPNLRPKEGSKRYVSADKAFVLVIAANGFAGIEAQNARVEDDDAVFVVAIGGDGGGSAYAEASRGVAIALGGRGAIGKVPNGGGGGGAAANAKGAVGAISLGGEGGKGAGRGLDGSPGVGHGIVNGAEIIDLVKKRSK